jgi:RNA-splicing ligase RtcB
MCDNSCHSRSNFPSATELKRLTASSFRQFPGIERALIEEAPAAYKNIKEVLAQQDDLVQPVLRLEPLAVVKGA